MFGGHPEDHGRREGLRYLGYWRTRDRRFRDPRPDPKDFVDLSWDPAERARVVLHLRAGATVFTWVGSSTCRFCGLRPCGWSDLTDGVYGWPEGLAHYVDDHGLRPPDEFVRHVLNFLP